MFDYVGHYSVFCVLNYNIIYNTSVIYKRFIWLKYWNQWWYFWIVWYWIWKITFKHKGIKNLNVIEVGKFKIVVKGLSWFSTFMRSMEKRWWWWMFVVFAPKLTYLKFMNEVNKSKIVNEKMDGDKFKKFRKVRMFNLVLFRNWIIYISRFIVVLIF